MGSFELLESSKEKFPYDSTLTQVIFSDSLGNEFVGEISEMKMEFRSHPGANYQCEYDESKFVRPTSMTERISIKINFSELEVRFIIMFAVFPNFREFEEKLIADLGKVYVFEPYDPQQLGSAPITEFTIVLDERSRIEEFQNSADPNYIKFIHGEDYFDVYDNEHQNELFTVYFNLAKGLIGFKNRETGKSYKFERIE